jgi:hypothetical protein
MRTIILDGEEYKVEHFCEETDYEESTIRLVLALEKEGRYWFINPVLLLGKGVLSPEREASIKGWCDKHPSGKWGYSEWRGEPYTVELFWSKQSLAGIYNTLEADKLSARQSKAADRAND